MTKGQAFYQWLSGFGVDVYTAASVPDDVSCPYITYDLSLAAMGDGDQSCTLNLWYSTTSEAVPNAKAQEIADAIGRGGKILACDDGAMWIKRGSPFCTPITNENTNIKQRYINILVEYLTTD